MRMKHTVKFQSGSQEVYEFKTKSESDKALENAILLNKSSRNFVGALPKNKSKRCAKQFSN